MPLCLLVTGTQPPFSPVWSCTLLTAALFVDHSRELHNLVEDKEIAARAVAFVVNSTRKGIVPLCADVASLLRSKRRCVHSVSLLRSKRRCVHSVSLLRSKLTL